MRVPLLSLISIIEMPCHPGEWNLWKLKQPEKLWLLNPPPSVNDTNLNRNLAHEGLGIEKTS